MGIHRRLLLQYTGLAGALSVVPVVLSKAAPELRTFGMRDAWARPRFNAGAQLLVDASKTHFSGLGLYLYPDWGQPRPYQVSARGALLEFRHPGTGQLLWTQSAGFDTGFAGRVLEVPEAGALEAGCPTLCVPALPTAG